ncbi:MULTISPECIES: GNAT family N-acetyltransferase [Nocardioides]|uniref:GNAT family N-acetyltransferase n=1 Tax=Nocardioides TaxID=1839 RepID=UPI0020402601|nr:GNAT family N-acetyltransferase [Nocardioides sp. P86]MCM3515105.1 N-acetyltransferase [Nocardioides sp. P86]
MSEQARTSGVTVRHEPGESRWAAYDGPELAGVAVYELADDPARVVFTHTVVRDGFEGRGVGSALARAALDEVRAAGERRVEPQCPFIAGWIGKHPDYADLVV